MSKVMDVFAEYAAGEPQRFVDWMIETDRKRKEFQSLIESGAVEPISEKDFRCPFRIS